LKFLNDDSYFEDLSRTTSLKQQQLEKALEENQMFKAIIDQRVELEKEKELAKLQIENEANKQTYIALKWRETIKERNKILWYFLRVTLLTIVSVSIPFLYKADEWVTKTIDKLGNYKYIIWIIIIVFLVIEVLGRGYLFNKAKVAEGWQWLRAKFNNKLLREIKNQEHENYEKAFNSQIIT